ncbi:PREDICTED: zinc metalloproteinase nas-14-like [Branchiostoma belcheri]|uniref:Metalloendopeptidase n=1 Tax=Branchiostoma belcheri TaxID=7741 RepID=A0A6P4ZKH6_BRABE|nr:PREDICTED: zinc metalloproteinase nas-14-like [Branchiostoma belcheri]
MRALTVSTAVLLVFGVGPVASAPGTACKDENGNCAGWAAVGECDANPGYMLFYCAESCGLCSRSESDVDPKAIVTAPAGSELQLASGSGWRDAGAVSRYQLSWKGTILHELMHVVGFWHEHQRPDRDDYVTIRLQNAEERYHHAFDKLPNSRKLGLSYDYGSIMHYESYAFSINGRQTIVPKLPLNGVVLGETEELSSLDIRKINKLYDC